MGNMDRPLRKEEPQRTVLHLSSKPGEAEQITAALTHLYGRPDLKVVQITKAKNVLPDLVNSAHAITLSFKTPEEAIPFLQQVFKHRADVPAIGLFEVPDGVSHLRQRFSLKTALLHDELKSHGVENSRGLALEIHRRVSKVIKE